MTQYLIVPGLGNSGPEHWQTYFEQHLDHCSRIQQAEWDAPDCSDWVETIDAAVLAVGVSSVVLIAHSLGCTAIAHWNKRFTRSIRGALLVAPSDIESPVYDFPATGFAPVPLQKLPFRSLVVASENDVWVSEERARFFADCWGSEFVTLGEAGHVNVAAGFGRWEAGLDLVRQLG